MQLLRRAASPSIQPAAFTDHLVKEPCGACSKSTQLQTALKLVFQHAWRLLGAQQVRPQPSLSTLLESWIHGMCTEHGVAARSRAACMLVMRTWRTTGSVRMAWICGSAIAFSRRAASSSSLASPRLICGAAYIDLRVSKGRAVNSLASACWGWPAGDPKTLKPNSGRKCKCIASQASDAAIRLRPWKHATKTQSGSAHRVCTQ